MKNEIELNQNEINLSRSDATEHALDKLGFQRIRAEIAGMCVTEKAKKRALSMTLLETEEQIEHSMAFIQDTRFLIERDPFPLDGIADIRNEIELSKKDGTLEPDTLWKIKRFCYLVTRLDKFVRHGGKELLTLAPFLTRLIPTPDIQDQVERFIEAPGTIKENATPLLVSLRVDIRRSHDRVTSKLERMLTQKQYEGFFQDDIITFRNDRFVLPVKIEMSSRFEGVVHDRSGSGQTVFMEPLSVISDNNDLKNLKLEVEKERMRILSALTELVRRNATALYSNQELLFILDYYVGCARFGDRMECNVPNIGSEDFVLTHAYNPILLLEMEREKIVPLSFNMNSPVRGFLMTGPNMGGKTVSLKTAGLVSAMALAGLPVPAEKESRIPLYDSIFADIGDEQSIEFSLSSFAAHVKRWQEAAVMAGEKSLVLLDELGASTDPVEGVPLVIALMEKLLDNRARMIVTTHLSETLPYAEKRSDMENCSMAFDQENLSSTFRFRQGIPERSFAIAVASRLGLDRSVIERSRYFASKETLRLDTLLENLSAKLNSAENLEHELEVKLKDTQIKSRRLAELIDIEKEKSRKLSETKERLERESSQKIEMELMHRREEIKKQIQEILDTPAEIPDTSGLTAEQKKAVRREDKRVKSLRRLKQSIDREAKDVSSQYTTKKGKPVDIESGQRVYIKRLHKEGMTTDSTDDKGYIKVNVGQITLRVHTSNLDVLNSPETELHQPKPIAPDGISYTMPDVEKRKDVRGLHFNEAWDDVNTWIDNATRLEMERLELLHGKGTGALGRKFHKQLSRDKRVKKHAFAPQNEGGMGVTIIELQ